MKRYVAFIAAAVVVLAGCDSTPPARVSTPGNPFGSKAHLSLEGLGGAQDDAMDLAGDWMFHHHNTAWETWGFGPSSKVPPCARLSSAAFRCVVTVEVGHGMKYVRLTERIAMGPSPIPGGPDIVHEDVIAVYRFPSS